MSGAIDEEMLMAYADGELDEESARVVARAVAADPELARRLDVFEESAGAVRDLFAAPLREPVPDWLVATVMNGPKAQMVPFARRPAVLRRAVWPLAACLALAVGLAGGLALQRAPQGGPSAFGDDPVVLAALAGRASGAEAPAGSRDGASGLRLLGSYRVADGLCRVFARSGAEGSVRGVGCDRGEGYAIELLARAGPAEAFSPASQDAVAAIDGFLDAREAVGPLSPEEEAPLLSPDRDR